jgi:hypothetical protein
MLHHTKTNQMANILDLVYINKGKHSRHLSFFSVLFAYIFSWLFLSDPRLPPTYLLVSLF